MIRSLDDLREHPDSILFECVSGSRAYGLATATSDEDRKGVFIMPADQCYGLEPVAQVQDARGDTVFYEIGRFIELASKANPNILEMLFTPEDCVISRHPLMERIPRSDFLTTACRDSFAGYAETQIRRARGLNKKIVNPMPEARKVLIEFCHVVQGQGSVPALVWLRENGLAQRQVGLVKIPHMPRLFGVFVDRDCEHGFRGICREDSNDVLLSSVPKGLQPAAYLQFNHDEYKRWNREHREYWDWVSKRNRDRYEQTVRHGGQYDAKNLMHTFRLLKMAADIAREGTIHVRRPDRDALLAIREGRFKYEELVERAGDLLRSVDALFEMAVLPPPMEQSIASRIVADLREAFYTGSG